MMKTLVVFLGLVGIGIAAILWYTKTTHGPVDSVVAAIRQNGKLVVGLDPSYPPMELKDKSGRIIGFDADLAKGVADGLGVAVEFKPLAFDSLMDAVTAGSIDVVISSVSITPERTQIVLFSNPYLNAGQAIIVAKTNNAIQTTEDLTGKRIAVQNDTTSEKEALKLTDDKNIVRYQSDYDTIVGKVESGQIDAIIMDYPVAADLARHDSGLKLAGKPFTTEFYGIVAKKEHTGLIQEINTILAELIANGTLSSLESTWLE